MNEKVKIKFANEVSLEIKREDLIHPIISGNKFRKLKYNINEAIFQNKIGIVTFGGAFSNHIVAVAAAGNEYNLKTIGIIRGEELKDKVDENPTLSSAKKLGMKLRFVSRETYKNKDDKLYLNTLLSNYDEYYLVPEGGTNSLAVKGCEEIIKATDVKFDYICCAVGTGGTISGIINSSFKHQKIIGFSSLKGNFLSDVICNFVSKNNWILNSDYHFGGYGKVTDELILFLNSFYAQTKIPLDPIYTGKMMFGVFNLIEKGFFPENAKILAIHTGGLQGIQGMNQMLMNKKKILINYEN